MATSPLFVGSKRFQGIQFIPGYSTRPRLFWSPGTIGSEITRISIATNDAAANVAQFFIARPITLQSDMGTGNFVDGGGGSDSITRTSGSFIVDGWRVGEILLAQGSNTLANDISVVLTGVSALALTFATASVAAAEEFPTGAILYRLFSLGYVAVPAGSGEPSVVGVSGLDTANMPWLDPAPDRLLELGPNDHLAAALQTAMGSGEILHLMAQGGDY